MCLAKFGQLLKPCSRAMTSCASARWKGALTNHILRLVLEPRVMARDAVERHAPSLCMSAEKIFRLLLVLLEAGLIG